MVTWWMLGFIPLFVAVWFGSMHLIALVGGWRDLARVYGAERPMEFARQWRNKYGRMRYATGYNGCLDIGANSMGMQLSLWKMFRPGHPPLFIPWEDLSTTPERGLFMEFIVFTFRRAPGVTLRLRRDLAEDVLHTAPGVTSSAWHTSPPHSFSSTR
jgi:hypothetical protein